MSRVSSPTLARGATPVPTGVAAGTRRRDQAEAWMLAYQRGDQAAFRALFEHYAPVVLRLGMRHLGNEDDARELVQQTFLRLHGARHDYRQGERLHPWLMTIVMNLVRDGWRRRKRKPTSPIEHEPEATDQPSAVEHAEARQRATALYAAMSELTSRQREVVELRWFQGYAFAEVAQIVGSTEGAVRVQAHRAYTALRGLLEAEHG